MSDAPVGFEEFADWRRVDPRTPLIYGAPVLMVAAWFVLVGQAGGGDVLFEALLPLAGVAAVLVRYLTGRYAVVDGAVRWKVGLLVHQATDIGLERIQDVEVTRPLLARVLGLAQVNVSSAGGGGEIKLQYLDHRVAERLGHLLQHRVAFKRQSAVAAASPAAAAAPPAQLHRVTSAELGAWASYRLWPAIPVVIVAAVVAATVDWRAALPVLPVAPFWFAGMVKPLLDRTNLTVTMDAVSLNATEGLTTVRRTSTQRERIQLVYGHQLWLQRLRGAETVRYASADVTIGTDHAVRQELALNVAVDSWGTLAAAVAQRQVIGPAWLRKKPAAASTATAVRWSFAGAAAGCSAAGVVGAVGAPIVVVAAVVVVGIAAGVAFGLVRGMRRVSVEGWAVTPADLLVRRGILRRTTLLLFAEKTQAVDVVSGPVQRRLGLATVLVDVAPPGRAHRVVVHDVTTADAAELLASLTASGSVALRSGV